MNEECIITEINDRLKQSNNDRGRKYGIWTVGITTRPTERRKEHSDDGHSVMNWKQWLADGLNTAQNVENHFKKKGMKGGTGGDVDPNKSVYVYIF